MKRNLIALATALIIVCGMVTFALSKGESCSGKVIEVKGDEVTIKVEKGKAASFSVGDSVELEIKKKQAGTEEEYLMGC